jgi:GNAT superfamily N-acetyltransferase
VVGRVAAILDKAHNRFHEENAGFFGFFECVNDPVVADALLQRARRWVFERGAKFLRGPVNPSTNYECGMLVEGFDSDPMVMMTYNPPYYPALMEQVGLHKAKDLYAWLSNANAIEMKKIGRVAGKVLGKSGVTVRPINMKDFAAEVAKVWEVYGAAWARNWGFIPMSRRGIRSDGQGNEADSQARTGTHRRGGGPRRGFRTRFTRHQSGAKTGPGKTAPHRHHKNPVLSTFDQNVRVLALGVVEEYRASGLAAAFYATLVRNARKLGYGDCEMSWILEDNVLMNRSLEVMGAKRYKTYRIYEWN